jgi:hypothetical protein
MTEFSLIVDGDIVPHHRHEMDRRNLILLQYLADICRNGNEQTTPYFALSWE